VKVRQVSIFLENKSGRLYEVCRCLADAGVNIRALSIAETADYGVLRLIVNDPDAAMQISTRFVEGLKADDPIQKKVLLATVELMKGEQLGVSSAQAWENTQNTLLAMGQIQKKMDVNEFFTNAFVP